MAYKIDYKAQYELVGVLADNSMNYQTKSGVIGFIVLDINTGVLKTLSNPMIYKSINNEASKIGLKKQGKCEINNVANIRGISININLWLTPEGMAEEIVNNIPYGNDCIPFLDSNDFNRLTYRAAPDKLKNHMILMKRSADLKVAQVFDMNTLKALRLTYEELENEVKLGGKIITNAFMSQGVLKLKKTDDSYEEAVEVGDKGSYEIKLNNDNELELTIKKAGIKILNLDLTNYVNPKIVTQTLVIKGIADSLDTLNIKTDNNNLLVYVEYKKEKYINRINLYGNIKRFSIYQSEHIVSTIDMSHCTNNVLKVMSIGESAPSQIINTTPNKVLSILIREYTELKKVYSRGDLLITSSNYVYNKYSIANLIKAEDLLTLPTNVVKITNTILCNAEYMMNCITRKFTDTIYTSSVDCCHIEEIVTSELSKITLCHIEANIKDLSKYDRKISLYHSLLDINSLSCDIDAEGKTVVAGTIKSNSLIFTNMFRSKISAVRFEGLRLSCKLAASENFNKIISHYVTKKHMSIQVDKDATLGVKDKNALVALLSCMEDFQLMIPYDSKLIEKYGLSDSDDKITIIGTKEQKETNAELVKNNRKVAKYAMLGLGWETTIKKTIENSEEILNYNTKRVKDIFKDKRQLSIKVDLADGKDEVKKLLGIDTSNKSNTIQISQAAFNVSQAIAKTFELDTSILDEEILSAVKQKAGLATIPLYTEDNFRIFYVCTKPLKSIITLLELGIGDTSSTLVKDNGQYYKVDSLEPLFVEAYIIVAANDKIMGSFSVGLVEVSGYKTNYINYDTSNIIDYSRRENLLNIGKDLSINGDLRFNNSKIEYSTDLDRYISTSIISKDFIWKDSIQVPSHLFLQPEGFTLCIVKDINAKVYVEISLYSNQPVYIVKTDIVKVVITTNSAKIKNKISKMNESLINKDKSQFNYIADEVKLAKAIKIGRENKNNE